VTENWILEVEEKVQRFASRFSTLYSRSEREVAAAFEIGCFHALLDFYDDSCDIAPQNLKAGAYRYLTTPSGKPENFSFVSLRERKPPAFEFELRQQIRIRSHFDDDIMVTPDLVVLKPHSSFGGKRDAAYAGGKRGLFFVDSTQVIAAHECKSLPPFPELLVSFLGILQVAHRWYDPMKSNWSLDTTGIHLAPSLFVGGASRALQSRMAAALARHFPLNIIVGLHSVGWDIKDRQLRRLSLPLDSYSSIPPSVTDRTRSGSRHPGQGMPPLADPLG
jgi:hypothetical protein